MSEIREPIGLSRGLTNYGDRDFARYLRLSFARSMGYSTEMLSRPVVGIASTYSEFNNCHRLVPELVVRAGRLGPPPAPAAAPTGGAPPLAMQAALSTIRSCEP